MKKQVDVLTRKEYKKLLFYYRTFNKYLENGFFEQARSLAKTNAMMQLSYDYKEKVVKHVSKQDLRRFDNSLQVDQYRDKMDNTYWALCTMHHPLWDTEFKLKRIPFLKRLEFGVRTLYSEEARLERLLLEFERVELVKWQISDRFNVNQHPIHRVTNYEFSRASKGPVFNNREELMKAIDNERS